MRRRGVCAEVEEADEEVLAGLPDDVRWGGDLDHLVSQRLERRSRGAVVEGADDTREPREAVGGESAPEVVPEGRRASGEVGAEKIGISLPRGETEVDVDEEESDKEDTRTVVI